MTPASLGLQKAQSLVSCSVCFCSSENLPQRLFSSLACESHLQSVPKPQGYWPRAERLWRLIERCPQLFPWPNLALKLPGQPAVMVFTVSCVGGVMYVWQQGACSAFLSFVLGRVFCLHEWDPSLYLFRPTQWILFIGLVSMSVGVGFFLGGKSYCHSKGLKFCL